MLAPALGPIIGNFSASAESWRWVSWEMLWLSGPICVLLFFFLPETSSPTILYYRARRLRKLTGNASFRSQAEIDQAKLTVRQIVYDALIKPTQINALDPAVLFSTIYTSLVYGIFYSFFESFPLVYQDVYRFSFSISSLPFLGVLAGLAAAGGLVIIHWHFYVVKTVMREGTSALGQPEKRLVPALFGCFWVPIGLFLFGIVCFPYQVMLKAKLLHRMDRSPQYPLDCNRRWPIPQYFGDIYHYCLPALIFGIHISKIFRLPVRSQRLCAGESRCGGYHVLQTHVHQPRYPLGSEPTWVPHYHMLRPSLLPLELGRQAPRS